MIIYVYLYSIHGISIDRPEMSMALPADCPPSGPSDSNPRAADCWAASAGATAVDSWPAAGPRAARVAPNWMGWT